MNTTKREINLIDRQIEDLMAKRENALSILEAGKFSGQIAKLMLKRSQLLRKVRRGDPK